MYSISVKKISKACGSLANLRYCVNVNLLREVYHSLVHSYLRYGILVWGNASESTLQPLKCLINRAVRIMLFAPFGRIDLDPLYDYLKILDVDKVKMLETSKFMYKQKNNAFPVTIAYYFEQKISQGWQKGGSVESRKWGFKGFDEILKI